MKNLHVLKKITAVVMLAAMAAAVTGCGETKIELLEEPVLEYGESQYFTKEDQEEAISIIKDTMAGWSTQCNIQNITYAGDEMALKGIYYCNSMIEASDTYKAAMVFLVDFVTPSDAKGFKKNTLYEDWEWYIVKDEDGSWAFFNNGQNISDNIDIPDGFDLESLIDLES